MGRRKKDKLSHDSSIGVSSQSSFGVRGTNNEFTNKFYFEDLEEPEQNKSNSKVKDFTLMAYEAKSRADKINPNNLGTVKHLKTKSKGKKPQVKSNNFRNFTSSKSKLDFFKRNEPSCSPSLLNKMKSKSNNKLLRSSAKLFGNIKASEDYTPSS